MHIWISDKGTMHWEPFNSNKGNNKTLVNTCGKIRFGRNHILTSMLLATCKPARLVTLEFIPACIVGKNKSPCSTCGVSIVGIKKKKKNACLRRHLTAVGFKVICRNVLELYCDKIQLIYLASQFHWEDGWIVNRGHQTLHFQYHNG